MAKGAARPKGSPDEPKYRRLIFGLPPELDDALRKRADQEDRPLAWVVRRAIENYLNTDDGSANAA